MAHRTHLLASLAFCFHVQQYDMRRCHASIQTAAFTPASYYTEDVIAAAGEQAMSSPAAAAAIVTLDTVRKSRNADYLLEACTPGWKIHHDAVASAVRQMWSDLYRMHRDGGTDAYATLKYWSWGMDIAYGMCDQQLIRDGADGCQHAIRSNPLNVSATPDILSPIPRVGHGAIVGAYHADHALDIIRSIMRTHAEKQPMVMAKLRMAGYAFVPPGSESRNMASICVENPRLVSIGGLETLTTCLLDEHDHAAVAIALSCHHTATTTWGDARHSKQALPWHTHQALAGPHRDACIATAIKVLVSAEGNADVARFICAAAGSDVNKTDDV